MTARDQDAYTPTRAECLASANALDGALHLLNDDESAEILARLADAWREQAVTARGGGSL